MTVPDRPTEGWLIHKAGRGWYRPKAQGYTAHPSEAGRYSYEDAMSYSHPNGWRCPRDGITIKHESELGQKHTTDPAVQALVEAAREVYRISERDHVAWRKLSAALATFDKAH